MMRLWQRTLCLLLCLLMLLALAACSRTAGALAGVKTLAAPAYPTERVWTAADSGGLDAFTARSLPVLFSGLNGENRVYSPLNIYMALGMLAEISGGESRGQLLSLLGSADIEALRAGIKTLWEAGYCDEDWLTVLPAASMWLREGSACKPEALRRLAEDYYASAFSAPMGAASTDRALRDWINERTNHLLEQQAENLHLDANTVIALVTTLYFKSGWLDRFSDKLTKTQSFHAENGDRETDFMHNALETDYYRGGHFGAVCLSMNGGAAMWLLLPDEDSNLQALIDGGEAAALLTERRSWEDREKYTVCLSLPKFDVSADFSLIEALQSLGVTAVFDPQVSDFSPLTDQTLAVTQAQHAVRVKIDEEGCEAAAYTVIDLPAAAAPPQETLPEIDFVCDRPFLFAVTLNDALLFVGAVNDPTA